ENSGLIWSVARRYYGRGAEPDDLYQLACVGFIKAVRGFDPALGNAFSTYAVPKIAGEIRRFLRDDGAVKVSRAVKERSVKLRRMQSELESRSEEHTSELQSRFDLVCRLLLEKKKINVLKVTIGNVIKDNDQDVY